MGLRLRLRNRLRVLAGNYFAEGDVHWTRQKAQVVFPLTCVLAGMAAGLLGIGGICMHIYIYICTGLL